MNIKKSGVLMNYTNISRVDVLTEPDVNRSHKDLVKSGDKLWNKVVQGNVKVKIKFGLSVIYFVSLVYFTIQLFV